MKVLARLKTRFKRGVVTEKSLRAGACNKPLKVLTYMCTPGGLTGAPRRLLTLADQLQRNGIKVCVVSESGTDLLHEARQRECETASMNPVGLLSLRKGALLSGGVLFRLRILINLLRQNLALYRCIRRSDADIVWVRGSKGIAFGALGVLISRCPLVWDVDYEPASQGLISWLHRFGLWASLFVVVQYSNAPRKIFGRALSDRYHEKFRVMLPGIDCNIPKESESSKTSASRSSREPFVILHMGMLCERKNQRLLIDALQLVKMQSESSRIQLRLAGAEFDEGYESALKRRVAEKNLQASVEFLGWQSDVYELMSTAHILAMPSRDEGVPNAIQEAMAMGLPVMVSDSGGMPEVVMDSETGWVLDSDRPEAWAAKILWCLQNEERVRDVARNAKVYASDCFTMERWGLEYSNLIRKAFAKD